MIVTVCDFVLRVVALLLSLAAAVVAGVNRHREEVGLTLIPGLPAFDVEISAKWHYLSPLVYFVIANAIAAGYAALSAILTLISRGKRKGLVGTIVILDVFVVAILFSSFGAALAVGIIGYKGNSRLQWNEVCSAIEAFCHQITAALALSGVASLVFLLLPFIGVFNLQKAP